jgi:outer membrane lipoprotein SlyB
MFLIAGMPNLSNSAPRNATAFLLDGRIISGDIVAVPDSSLIVAPERHSGDEWIRSHVSDLVVVKFSKIRKLILSGRALKLEGAGVGALAGCVFGAVLGANSVQLETGTSPTSPSRGVLDRWGASVGGGFVGAICGGLLGLGVGGNITSGSREIDVSTRTGIEELKLVSRYHDGESMYRFVVTQLPIPKD